MGAVKIFSIKDVLASFSTAIATIPNLLLGAAKEGTIIISPVGDTPISSERGVDGETCLSSSGNPEFEIKLKLMQTSSINDLLTTIYLAGVNSPGMIGGIGPLNIMDSNGTKKFFDQNASIQSVPEITLENKIGYMEWIFKCPNLIWFGGGNNPV
jgi:hypothetical protein